MSIILCIHRQTLTTKLGRTCYHRKDHFPVTNFLTNFEEVWLPCITFVNAVNHRVLKDSVQFTIYLGWSPLKLRQAQKPKKRLELVVQGHANKVGYTEDRNQFYSRSVVSYLKLGNTGRSKTQHLFLSSNESHLIAMYYLHFYLHLNFGNPLWNR